MDDKERIMDINLEEIPADREVEENELQDKENQENESLENEIQDKKAQRKEGIFPKKNSQSKGSGRKGGCFRTVVTAVVLVCIIGISFLAGRQSVMTSSGFGTGLNNGAILRKLSWLEAYTGKYYLNKMDSDNVEQNIYKGFAKGLEDPYAEYYTKAEYKQLTEEDSGEYEGIGISVAKDTDTGYAEIVSVFKDQPAYKAGLKNGDLIIAVNKKSTADMELQDVVSEIKKKENKKVVLTIYRDKKSKEYTVEKSSVQLDTVSYKMKDNKVGYIAVSQFLENTGDQFEDAITALEKKGMKSLIIDLRDNGGGLLDTCTQMLSRIIAKDKMLVYTKDKEGNKQEFKSDSDETLDVPIVILTNGNTASASEIMTGCLKDYGKATVVGTKTYGKGIVQNIMPLPDGSAIKFTVAKYYTPNGTDIHKKGIKPDVKVKISDEDWKKAQTDEKADTQLKKAMEILQK